MKILVKITLTHKTTGEVASHKIALCKLVKMATFIEFQLSLLSQRGRHGNGTLILVIDLLYLSHNHLPLMSLRANINSYYCHYL